MLMEQKQNPAYFETPSQVAHRRERFRYILLPMIIAGVLLLLLMTYLAVFNNRIKPDLEVLSVVSVVFLSLPFFVLSLIKLVILIGIIYGLTKLKPLIPVAGITVLQAFEKARWYLRKAADMSVQPILSLREGAHKLSQVKRSLELRFLDKGK
jgi:ABC-type dipeptide/oligopeptide/nickel transport system permease component